MPHAQFSPLKTTATLAQLVHYIMFSPKCTLKVSLTNICNICLGSHQVVMETIGVGIGGNSSVLAKSLVPCSLSVPSLCEEVLNDFENIAC